LVESFEHGDVLLLPAHQAKTERRLLLISFLVLCGTAAALILSPAVRTGSWQTALRPQFLIPLLVWMVMAAALYRWMQRWLPAHDPVLAPVILLLSGWGLLEIWRLAPAAGLRQAVWLVLAVLAAAVIIRFSAYIQRLQEYRLVWLVAGLFLTSLTLLFGTNPSGAEPDLWFRFFGVYIQPSEPLRLVLAIYLAAFYASRLDFLSMPSMRHAGSIAPIFLIYGLSIILLVLQRDLGTAILFAGVLTLMLFLATHRWMIFIAAAVVLAVAGALGALLYDVVQIRINAWLVPWQDPLNNSYQIVQALISFAAGGLFGTGPGLGSPGFVPAAHTDFIYTAVGEEFGFLGTFILIILYLVLISRGLRIAMQQREPFSRMLASGIVITIALQALLIMGGNVRLFPLTGVTLPYMSYGGSSLLTSFVGFGLLVALSRQQDTPRPDKAFRTLQSAFMAAFLLLALFTSWWSVFQRPSLLSRSDNYRRFVESRFQARGAILDHNGRVIASSSGEPGSFTRNAPWASLAPLVGYDSNQLGQSGLEESLDPYLRGTFGYPENALLWSYMMDGTSPGGLDVRLTIDLPLQQEIYALLESRRGAVVVLDSWSGSILAMVSSPSFDSNTLEEEWENISIREDAPLLNRAVQGAYQPGTALAPILLAWQFETRPEFSSTAALNYTHAAALNGMELRCAMIERGQASDRFTAARTGCPAVALEAGEALGTEGFSDLLEAFKLEQQLQLELPENQLSAAFNSDALLDLAYEASGQGEVLLKPLQMARSMAVLQTGSLPDLRLVQAVHMPDGTWQDQQPEASRQQLLSAETHKLLQDGFHLDGGQPVCFFGQAYTGSDYETLAWTNCLVYGTSPMVVTLILEDHLPSDAAVLTGQLLSLPQLTAP